jgi:hypothetical protein
MKMKSLFFPLALLLLVTVVRAPAASTIQTIARINADAQKPGGPDRVLQSISASTHVPAATLEKQKAKTGLTYGDLFMAHSIAKAAGKSFEEIAAMKAKGQTWDQISDANNVSLDGKKKVVKVQTKPTPSPTPVKSLRQEQNDRYK